MLNIDVLHQALHSSLLVNCFPDICSPFNVIQYRCIDRELSHSVSWLTCPVFLASREGVGERRERVDAAFICSVHLSCLVGRRCPGCAEMGDADSAQCNGRGQFRLEDRKRGRERNPGRERNLGASGSRVSSLISVNLDLPAVCLGCCEGQETRRL